MLISATKKTVFGSSELIKQWQENDDTTLWIDLDNVELEEEKRLLTQFNCHPLAINDALRERHPPKIELFNDYIFMLYRGIIANDDGLRFAHLQISMFIGKRVLITRHPQSSLAINELFSESSEKYLKRSPVHLALRLFHSSCGYYLKEMFSFEAELEKIEDDFQSSGNDKMMKQITSYRSQLVKIRRTFNYHVTMGERLKAYVDDEDTDLITDKEIHTVNDLRERLDRLLSLSQMYYDICGDLINGYMSVTSHQLNATMRVLTVITALFVPLTFLAGIYGMNFEYIPELKAANGYFILLGVMAVVSVVLLMIFKKKRWL
ncbi:magnesium transporter CorA family protein [Colwellia sp. MB02u-18]|nr:MULTISPECIES: magnesium transporter CorA family protein [unclassified Colwellia]MBA6324732.1 magnesium transporter CorA family protein [Colwellia sp. MB02u-18]MBA6225302.1 magnesium transporter CorA family protein [Colwellia sp. MB3u-45]MBA6267248.1 magnesium transporter CorA family protein [Colwellia sp. MB3u-43]MBA6322860.1 magnesium transporter CorA family protein [Colwellia sp. MB02u-19]MBA6331077.1 magnesium transporter CorA family protein [Colwellia sp. MB02u-12]